MFFKVKINFSLDDCKYNFYMSIHRSGGNVGNSVLLASGRLGFESQQRQTYVVKTGSDSSIAKRWTLCVSVTGPRR